jgi:hypothetical protein
MPTEIICSVVTFDTQAYGKVEVSYTVKGNWATHGSYADGEVYFAADDLYSTMTGGKFCHPFRGIDFEFEPASRWPGSAHLLRATIPVLVGIAPKK